MASGWRSGGVILFLGAWTENLLFDLLGRIVPPLTPPHLLHAYMPEAIRDMVSPAVLAPVTSAVLAAIALLCLSLVPPGTPRRFPAGSGKMKKAAARSTRAQDAAFCQPPPP
ncbi:MAG: hypothetical protein WCS72_19250, partial [Deltaproteobacteria bacterium]